MMLVEQIRNLSEFLVYAEKFQKNYFELFIEVNVMEHFTRFLYQNNRYVNIQLIQTMSILIQNIEDKMKIFYIFSHAFMNELISFDYDFSFDDELVDYFVSFLKSLTLKLTDETINFFFNDKFKTFPLYHQAVKFYNHKEAMVRTSVRTITLTIYHFKNQKMKELFLGLPYCSYFANLACYLRDFWVQIDKHVVSLTQDPKQIDLMMSDAEDANETLFYIQDILHAGDRDLNNMLSNALLHYAYLPTVVQSLCVLKHRPQLSLNTCLYVLTQTFRIIKYTEFTNLLFASLFFKHLPSKIINQMDNLPKNPTNYSSKFINTHLNSCSLAQYVEEYYNLHNMDVFLLYGSQNFAFLNEIKKEYESKIKEMQESNVDNDCELKEEDVKVMVKKLIFAKLSEEEIADITKKHILLSEGLGAKVGLINKLSREEEKEEGIDTVISQFEVLKSKISDKSLQELQACPNKEIILSFLRSKDDNLLLLVGGLIMSIQYNNELMIEFIEQVPEICPYRFLQKEEIKQSNQEEEKEEVKEEEKKEQKKEEEEKKESIPITVQPVTAIVNLILEKFDTDPQFRNFTLRLYAKLLFDLHPPASNPLPQDQRNRIINSYKLSIHHMKRIVHQMSPNNQFDPYFNFWETLKSQISRFAPIDTNMEFNRHLAQPMLMLPFIPDELQSRIGESLKLPKLEDDSANIPNYVQNFLLMKSLVYEYTELGKEFQPQYKINIEYGEAEDWIEGDLIAPIPQDRRYQNCYLRSPKNNLDQMFLMSDENFFVLLKPNFSIPTHIKAAVQYKCKHKYIVDNLVSKQDPKNLFIAIVSQSNPDVFIELILFFEDRTKCQETKDYLDFKRKEQLEQEKKTIEKFLVEVCEAEIAKIS